MEKAVTLNGVRQYTCKLCGLRNYENVYHWRKKPQRLKNICTLCLEKEALQRQSARERTYDGHFNICNYLKCISDLLANPDVQQMHGYIQHGDTTTLQHTLFVSYLSFRIAYALGLDYRSTARAALLHDFQLFDWHDHSQYTGWVVLAHPRAALKNAE